MQTQHGTAAEEAILANERSFRARLLIDWNQDGGFNHSLSDLGHYIDSAKVDRSLSGSAPEEILLIEGSAAAEFTATLHGEIGDYSLPAIFSPYNSRSPLYGNPMVGAELSYEIGVESPLGVFWYPQFIGNVRTITPNRADATVEITALDRAEHLRRPIQLPPWAISEKHETVNHSTAAQLANTSWVIDSCLRQCGVSCTPYAPLYRADINDLDFSQDGTQLFVTGAGSWLPTVGWAAQRDKVKFPNIDNDETLVMYERYGMPHPDAKLNMNGTSFRPFNMAALAAHADRGEWHYWGADRDSLAEGGIHHISFTAITSGVQNKDWWKTANDITLAEVFFGGKIGAKIKLYSGGNILAQVMRTTGDNATLDMAAAGEMVATYGVQLDPDGDYTRVHIAIDNSGPVRASLKAENETYSDSTGIHTIRATTWWPDGGGNHAYKGYAKLFTRIAIADFSWVGRHKSAGLDFWWNGGKPAKYGATLDAGLQRLSYMPLRNGDDAWQVITDVASSEFGSVFWDEQGIFRFWNYETMLAKQNSVVRQYNLDYLSQLTITNTFDSVRNIWTAEMTKKVGVEGTVYQSDSITEFYMPPRDYYENDTHKTRVWSEDIISADPQFIRPCTQHPAYTTVKSWEDATSGYIPTFFKGLYHTGDYTDVERWEEDAGLHADVSVNAFYDAGGSLVLQVWNSTPYPMRLATSTVHFDVEQEKNADGVVIGETITADYSKPNDAQPALRIAGNVISDLGSRTDEASSAASRKSVEMYGGRNFKVSGDWIQYGYDFDKVTETLQPRMLKPAPSTDAITVAGDPRVQLGDLIMVRDADGFGDNIKLQVYGISREFSLDGGLVDTLTVEMIQPVPLDLEPENPLPEITRINLCGNPSLVAGNDVQEYKWWGPSAGSVVRPVTGMPRDTAFWTSTTGVTALPRANIDAGSTYRFSAYIKASDSDVSGTCGIDFYDEVGRMEGASVAGYPWSAVSGSVVRADTGPVVAPEGAVVAVMSIEPQTAPVDITAVLYEETSVLRDYFDGDTQGASWDGPRGYATSRMLAVGEEPDPGTDFDSAATRFGWGAKDASSDEFEGQTVLDINKWGIYGRGGNVQPDGSTTGPVTDCWVGHDGNGRRCMDTVTVQDGYMRITGFEDGDSGGVAHHFDQKYGRWEIRARMNKAAGATGYPYHAVLIIWPEDERWPESGEYDFLEVNIGDDTAGAFMHYPHPQDVPVQQEYAEYQPGLDLTEWHNYGFEWTADALVGYIDGIEWFRFTGGGGPNGRDDIQNMPSGHLAIQLDNFNSAENGQNMEEAYMDIAWARAYPLRALNPPPIGGHDGSMDPPT